MAIFAVFLEPKKNAFLSLALGFVLLAKIRKLAGEKKEKKKHTTSPSILFNFLLPTFLCQPYFFCAKLSRIKKEHSTYDFLFLN